MESSDTEGGTAVDCTVGSIVWVRRRNGSWWPGKILGSDELSVSHLMSPRSGTPVKLLGREDASVDWYNLEKSKRVKPFRCGEFDDCIERAEASQGLPPKKREKYARREDAILHALELEKELLEKKFGKLDHSSNGKSKDISDGAGKVAASSPESLPYGEREHINSESVPLSEDADGSLAGTKQVLQSSGDDDVSDLQPRMKGLEDLGCNVVPSKRQLSSSGSPNGSDEYIPDDSIQAFHESSLHTQNLVSVEKNLVDKRRRLNAHSEDSLGKRRDKRRPIIQVLESSAKLPISQSLQLQSDGGSVPSLLPREEQAEVVGFAERDNFHTPVKSNDSFDYKQALPVQIKVSRSHLEESNRTYPTAMSEDDLSGSTEDTETDASDTDSLESDTDDSMTGLSDEVEPIELVPKSLGWANAHGNHGSMSSEELDDFELPGDFAHSRTNEPVSPSVTVSKWQLKGKRNNRSTTRYPNMSGRKVSKVPMHGMFLKGEVGSYGGFDDDSALRKQMVGYESGGLPSGKRTAKNWDDLSWNDNQPSLRGYWEESVDYYDPVSVDHRFDGRRHSTMVDVEVQVQSSYQRERVPIISLMSKLNGKAIVGHPIQIETLEEGSSETLLAAAGGGYQSETLEYDSSLQPSWRTARRSANSRVPRPSQLSTLEEEEFDEPTHFVDRDGRQFGKPNAVSSSHRAGMTRKLPSMDRKLVRKQPKKMSLSSNQKTRTLSSIGTHYRHNNDLKLHSSNSYQEDSLIKPQSLPTAVACIPVKLVFSRLNEELVARHQ